MIKDSLSERFKLKPVSDICYQVHIYNDDDLKYWTHEAHKKGYLIGFDYHVHENYTYERPEFDVYQIFPPSLKDRIHLKGDATR